MGKEGEREREQIEREGMRRLRIGKKIDRFSLTGAADDKFAARYVSVCLREIVRVFLAFGSSPLIINISLCKVVEMMTYDVAAWGLHVCY